MSIYAVTSLIASLYLRGRHSTEALQRMASKPVIWLTPLHRAELTHAIEQHVFWSHLSLRESKRVFADFEADRAPAVWAEVSFPDLAFEVCTQLARRDVGRLGGRTLETLHVACALELNATPFGPLTSGRPGWPRPAA